MFLRTLSSQLKLFGVFAVFVSFKTMKTTLIPVIVICCSLSCLAQETNPSANLDNQQNTIARQILVNDLENQVKDVPLAAVRSLVRYRMASWLWLNGKDDTGYAGTLATKALEELYLRKNETPDLYRSDLSSRIFALLEANSPDDAKRFREKFGVTSDPDLNSAFSLFGKKDGPRLISDKLVLSLQNQAEISPQAISLIEELEVRRLPELIKVLSQVLDEDEKGRSHYSAESLFYLVNIFRGQTITAELRRRFYLVAIRKAKEGLVSSDTDVTSAYDLINASLPDISINAEDLFSEASILRIALSGRATRSSKEYREISERIEKAPDKLKALISEAENTDDRELRASLLTDAANLAIEKKQFQSAMDLVEKLAELRRPGKVDKHFDAWHDQFMSGVAVQSLKENDTATSVRAADKILDSLTKADILRKTALYYFERRDFISASNTLNDSRTITNQAENSARKVSAMLRLILAFEKIDKFQMSRATEEAAKTIDATPSLGADDRPESENYEKHINSVMTIDMSLLPMFTELLKEDRMQAVDFANRIKRREIKIIASYALMIDSMRSVASSK